MFKNMRSEISRVRDGRVYHLSENIRIDFPTRLQTQY